MRIGYDAKRIFHNTTGLGNYGRDLVRMMGTHYPGNEYLLFNPKPARIHRLELTPNMTEKKPDGFWKFFPSLWRSRGILHDLKQNRIDIYHGLSGELPFGISRSGIPSVLTVHDLIFMRFPQWYKSIDRKIYTAKIKRAINEATQIVAISEQTKQDLVELIGVKPEQIQVVYQTCHRVFKVPQPHSYLEQIQEKYQLPADFVLYVGTIEPRKNAFTLVKALKNLPYPAVLVGRKTAYAREIEQFVEDNNMQKRIIFLEGLKLQELAALYRLAKVFVYPSIYEGFGIPLIEALYSGTPVITNANGVFPEAAGPGGIYLENIFDTEEMREKIRDAMETDLTERIEQGKAYVRRFDEEMLAKQWNGIYQSLLPDDKF